MGSISGLPRWIIVAMAPTVATMGCSQDFSPPPPPFVMGTPAGDDGRAGHANPDSPPALIEIAKPKDDITVKPLEKFDCEARITVPDGAGLPVFLTAFIRDGEKDARSYPLLPKSRQGGAYVLEGTLRAPDRPKRFRLVLDAVYEVSANPVVVKGDSKGSDSRTVHHYIQGPAIIVRKR